LETFCGAGKALAQWRQGFHASPVLKIGFFMDVSENRTSSVLSVFSALGILCLGFAVQAAPAPAGCQHRGNLDVMFCDENKDLVADPPKDPRRFKNPSTLVFTYTPVEDAAIYENIFKPFTAYLGQCTGKRVVYDRVQSNAAEIEAMRSGRLHVAGFSTGPTNYAVNQAGAVPFAVKGTARGLLGYHLILIVKQNSLYQKPTDLHGKKIAHVQPSSNSGNLAPRALFPALGLTPDQDYKVLYSGKHDNSIMGVVNGDYDAAPVASGVFKRMAARGQIREDDFRIIWRSELFPTTSFAYAHDLDPKLRDSVIKCFYDYRFPKDMQKTFEGADRFYPITYQKDWSIVRKVAERSGEKFNSAAFAALKKKEADEAAAKTQAPNK
jgi:phosphonate transport system substrate-binding protein